MVHIDPFSVLSFTPKTRNGRKSKSTSITKQNHAPISPNSDVASTGTDVSSFMRRILAPAPGVTVLSTLRHPAGNTETIWGCCLSLALESSQRIFDFKIDTWNVSTLESLLFVCWSSRTTATSPLSARSLNSSVKAISKITKKTKGIALGKNWSLKSISLTRIKRVACILFDLTSIKPTYLCESENAFFAVFPFLQVFPFHILSMSYRFKEN